VLAICQGIHAKIPAMNLTAMVRNLAQLLATRRFAHRKYDCQVRACSALSAIKHNLVSLLLADPKERRALLENLARSLSSAVETVRPDLSFPRVNPGKLKPGFHPAHKRTAEVDGIAVRWRNRPPSRIDFSNRYVKYGAPVRRLLTVVRRMYMPAHAASGCGPGQYSATGLWHYFPRQNRKALTFISRLFVSSTCDQ
jgi:LmbE family N-acetylglucosaminyl deacetylase